MKWIFSCLLAACLFGTGWAARSGHLTTAASTRDAVEDFIDRDDDQIKAHWALLIAGSAGWGNYRHQADVCHAYHLLRQGGLDDEHIVVMMQDDIADNPENPHPGKIFNSPGGEDLYAGVPKDYVGEAVTAETFLAALTGNVTYLKGKGSGKAIVSGPSDRVFVFYSDHGAPGVLGMPNGPFLYANDLMAALHRKANKKGFKEAVLYIEACESGSMFEGLLEDNIGIYATTASNAFESSWATYCPGMDPPPPPEFTTCLGDLYSVAWMENCEQVGGSHETLEKQFKLVAARTSQNFTYMEGSHVMQYGDLAMDVEMAGDYMGMSNGTNPPSPSPLTQGAVNQRDAELLYLRVKLQRATTQAERLQAQSELDAEVAARNHAAATSSKLATALLLQPTTATPLLRRLPWPSHAVAAAQKAATQLTPRNCLRCEPTQEPPQLLIDLLLFGDFGRPSPDRPLVDDWACLRAMVEGWEQQMGTMTTFSMQYTRLFANLCNAGLQPRQVAASLRTVLAQPQAPVVSAS